MKTIYSMLLLLAFAFPSMVLAEDGPANQNVDPPSQYDSSAAHVGEAWCDSCGKWIKTDCPSNAPATQRQCSTYNQNIIPPATADAKIPTKATKSVR